MKHYKSYIKLYKLVKFDRILILQSSSINQKMIIYRILIPTSLLLGSSMQKVYETIITY